MTLSAKWKIPKYKADATKVAGELQLLGDDIQPEQIVEAAKNESSELHKCFEWDDSIAAQKYRLRQAQGIMQNLVVVTATEPRTEKAPEPVRLYYKTNQESGYKPIHIIMEKPDEMEALRKRAYAELSDFKRKYQMLSDDETISQIFELIK